MSAVVGKSSDKKSLYVGSSLASSLFTVTQHSLRLSIIYPPAQNRILNVIVTETLLFFRSAGGLAEEVNEPILQAAFVPFGELREVVLPLDPASSTCAMLFPRIWYDN